jgi:hypothetical protein
MSTTSMPMGKLYSAGACCAGLLPLTSSILSCITASSSSTLRYSCMASVWVHHMYPDVCHDLEWLPELTLALPTAASQPPHFHVREGCCLARPSQGKCQQIRQPLTITARKSTIRAFRGAVGLSDASLRANCFSAHIVSFAHEHHAISTPYRCRR